MSGSVIFKDAKEIKEDLRKLEALQQKPSEDVVPISVIQEIKAEINYVGAHSDYGMQCVFAIAIAIIDKHLERVIQNECKTDKETFEIAGK